MCVHMHLYVVMRSYCAPNDTTGHMMKSELGTNMYFFNLSFERSILFSKLCFEPQRSLLHPQSKWKDFQW